ncbi:uncharacterized protein [Watersipora subatra]|uniref:uncharacterized protein n=1 Tax=Watersipora subatra TaxID=2589382 RepID=UPI00355BDA25
MSEGGSLRPPANFLAGFSAQNPSEANRSWAACLEQYDFYMSATEKNAKDESVQVATLLTILGAKGQELFRTFDLLETNRKKVESVKDAFTNYFAPKVKEGFERYKFYSQVQQLGESFDKFLSALKSLVSTCNFHESERDKALRDRIVFGIISESVRGELFNVPETLTISKCIEVCQRFEATKQYLNDFKTSNSGPAASVHTLNTQDKHNLARQNSKLSHDMQQKKTVTNCRYCGGSHIVRQCPAYDKLCKNCH